MSGLQLSFSAASAFTLGARGSISCSRRLSVVREEGFVLTFHFQVITLELTPLLIPASKNLKPEEAGSSLISTSSLQPSSGECHSSGSPGALCIVYHCAPRPSDSLQACSPTFCSHCFQFSVFPLSRHMPARSAEPHGSSSSEKKGASRRDPLSALVSFCHFFTAPFPSSPLFSKTMGWPLL